jgi:hypothetical protein
MNSQPSKRGFLTLAFGQEYVRCAIMLARSIKKTQSYVSNISIIVDDTSILTYEESKLFDKIVILPKREEIWQVRSEVWYHSPYEQTMFVESDILLTNDMGDWWLQLQNEELAVTENVRNFRNQIYTGTHYRRFFLENNLPNVYSGIMFWRKTKMVDEIFELWKEYTSNWHLMFDSFKAHQYGLLPADEGLALSIRNSGYSSKVLNPKRLYPSFIHCKTNVFDINIDDWTKGVHFTITKDMEFKLGYHRAQWPIHYQIKDLAKSKIFEVLS